MSNCNHIVAISGSKKIYEDNFERDALEWVNNVKYYNEFTLVKQITPPPNFLFAKFCMDCGSAINNENREARISELMLNNGDGSDTYNKILNAANRAP